jgi:formylmethanofuran dehydrogenase subunit E
MEIKISTFVAPEENKNKERLCLCTICGENITEEDQEFAFFGEGDRTICFECLSC